MDFDIAGLLANPDFQYMLAGIGSGMGQKYDNPFAQAVGGITMQGIGAKNQAALIARLLGQGGGAGKDGVSVGPGFDKISNQFLGADPTTKVSTDGKTATFTGPVGSFGSFSGGGGTTPPAPQAPMQTSALSTPPSGGQPGILNPSVGLPGDLSGLSLAGLKPEDINKAITLGLSGADLERRKVSDLLQGRYWDALIAEKEAARGAKAVLAPVEIPGVGQVSLDQFKAMPSDMKAYAYAMTQRRQNNQSTIPFEQFKRDTDPASMERLVNRAMVDPAFKDMWFKSKAAGATQINLGDKAALQEQTNAINNFSALKKPENSKLFEPTKEETSKLVMEHGIPGDPSYDKALAKFKINKTLGLVKGTGVTVLEKDVKIEGNELVIPVITKTGAKDVIRRTIR